MNANPLTLPSPRAGRARRAGAFTLIEILVVVGIIGLTLTMGVPAFVRALHKEGMRKVESDLLEACQKARGGAILKGAGYQELKIRPMERTFEAPGVFPMTTLPPEVSIQSISLNGMELALEDTDVVTVRFFAKGTSDEFAIVVRSNQDGTLCTVTLDQVTALADISTSR
ncbi:MAG: type II secretion system protein [Verrucomicrobiota bacterium]|jgi:type II secretory pathway pseudopilin PulG